MNKQSSAWQNADCVCVRVYCCRQNTSALSSNPRVWMKCSNSHSRCQSVWIAIWNYGLVCVCECVIVQLLRCRIATHVLQCKLTVFRNNQRTNADFGRFFFLVSLRLLLFLFWFIQRSTCWTCRASLDSFANVRRLCVAGTHTQLWVWPYGPCNGTCVPSQATAFNVRLIASSCVQLDGSAWKNLV